MRNVKKILQKRLFLTSSPAMLQKKNMTGLLYGHHVHTGCRFQCRVNKLLSISQGGYYGTWNSGADHLCRSYVHRRLPRHLRRQGVQVGLPGSPMRTALHPAGICMRFPPFFVSASLRMVRLCRAFGLCRTSPRPSLLSEAAPFPLASFPPRRSVFPASPSAPALLFRRAPSALFAPRPPAPPPFVPVRSILRLLLSSHLPATSHSPRLPFSCPLVFLLPFAPAGLPAFASPLRHMTAAPFPC